MISHGMTPYWGDSTRVKLIKIFHTLEDVTDWLPLNVGVELPLLVCNNPEKRSSDLLRVGSLKAR